jgi:iron complex transport system permease protein
MASEELSAHSAGVAARFAAARLTARRLVLVLVTLAIILIVFAVVATAIGSERLGIAEVLNIVTARIFGVASTASAEHSIIVWNARLPRVLMAIVVGGGLSVAGAGYQALLRNPLADPYILGVSTGAAVGAIGATILVSSWALSRPIAAFAGALVTIAVVYSLGQSRDGRSSERLVLAGVIINALLSSVVIFLVTAAAGARQRSVLSWLIGDLSGETMLLPLVAAFILAGALVIYVNSRSLNLMMTGEEEAGALGVEVGRVKLVVYLAASLMTGAAVAVSGVIGFVGLIIPHAVRLAGGSDNRLVVPASALAGAAFLLLADTVARTIVAPLELHIGVITALIGAPVFVVLLRRAG